MSAAIRLLAGTLLCWSMAGCTAPQTVGLVRDPGDLPPRAEVAEVPFFPQEKYHCGPAALAMTLAWSGLPVNQVDLVPQVYTPGREGSLRSDILGGARRNGRLAVPVGSLSDLLKEIAGGNPVLVFQNLAFDWRPQWHFAVAIGYDLQAREILLHSGTEARMVTALDTFEHTWKRGEYWALVVLPPDRLPATGGEGTVLRAALGLEQSDRPAAAATAYSAVLGRWPDSFGALMALGNLHYGAAELDRAAAAFRRAIAAHPGEPAPWNNLAYALARQGHHKEALAAAREAIRLAGEEAGPYRETLKELSQTAG